MVHAGVSDVENIGSKNSEGSKIYLNAQTWAVLGDVADAEKLPKILKAVDSMEHDFGFPLNLPPYQKYSPNVGRMSGMLPGLFENGGVYCHATGFKILMDCKVGRGSKAFETLKKLCRTVIKIHPCNPEQNHMFLQTVILPIPDIMENPTSPGQRELLRGA